MVGALKEFTTSKLPLIEISNGKAHLFSSRSAVQSRTIGSKSGFDYIAKTIADYKVSHQCELRCGLRKNSEKKNSLKLSAIKSPIVGFRSVGKIFAHDFIKKLAL